MKIIEINGSNIGSTGYLMQGIAHCARNKGDTVYTVCPKSRSNLKNHFTDEIIFGTIIGRNMHIQLAKFDGKLDLHSSISTYLLLKKFDKIKPDLIHIHNIHGNYINIRLLFDYIARNHIKVVWTLHDCWAFTGKCPHFVKFNCEKWKEKCFECPSLHKYPSTNVDKTDMLHNIKKEYLGRFIDPVFVAPSRWVAEFARQSFIKEHNIVVINNGVNLDIFYPRNSDFREKYGCREKYLLLSVMYNWGPDKGSDIIVELAQRLGSEYRIVFVGSDNMLDKVLPENIIKIHRTRNQAELAEIYSACNLFINPTRQEVFGLVNIEALACGTPVLTFNTGGCPECIDETCGAVVDVDDINAMIQEIERIRKDNPYTSEACVNRARKFDNKKIYKKYVELYKEVF